MPTAAERLVLMNNLRDLLQKVEPGVDVDPEELRFIRRMAKIWLERALISAEEENPP